MNNKGLEEDEELVPTDRLLMVKYISCSKLCIKKTLESKPMGHSLPLKKINFKIIYLLKKQFHKSIIKINFINKIIYI